MPASKVTIYVHYLNLINEGVLVFRVQKLAGLHGPWLKRYEISSLEPLGKAWCTCSREH